MSVTIHWMHSVFLNSHFILVYKVATLETEFHGWASIMLLYDVYNTEIMKMCVCGRFLISVFLFCAQISPVELHLGCQNLNRTEIKIFSICWSRFIFSCIISPWYLQHRHFENEITTAFWYWFLCYVPKSFQLNYIWVGSFNLAPTWQQNISVCLSCFTFS